MRIFFKSFVAFGLLLALASACNPVPRATVSPTVAAPAATAISTQPPTAEIPAPAIAGLQMLDATNGWAWTSSNHLLRTTNGGQTWADRTPEGQVWLYGFFSLDPQNAWLPVFLPDSNRFGMLHTADGGLTWTQYPYGPASNLHFTNTTNGWAKDTSVGAGNMFITLSETQDGGATWTHTPITPPQPEYGFPPGTLHLCSMCNDSFYYDPVRMVIISGDMATMQPGGSVRMQISFDLGKNWQSQNLPLPKEEMDALVSPDQAVFFDNNNGLLPVHLIKTNSDGSYMYQRLALYRTQDGGANWSLLPGVLDNAAPYTPMQIVSMNDIIVLCGNALCATHNGAQTWQTITSKLDFTQTDKRQLTSLDFIDANTGWVLLSEDDLTTLYKTVDGGATWTQIKPLLAASTPPTTVIDDSIPTPTLIPTPTPEP